MGVLLFVASLWGAGIPATAPWLARSTPATNENGCLDAKR